MKHELSTAFEAPQRHKTFSRAVQRVLLVLVAAFTRLAFADTQDFSSESNHSVLSVKRASDDAGELTYDMRALRQLPPKVILTALPPSLGIHGRYRWEGVSLKQLLGLAAAPSISIRISALNAYSVEIPSQDIQRYDPILAYLRDGKPMSVRTKGPLIVIYPFDQFPALRDQQHLNRTVWQVHEITVK